DWLAKGHSNPRLWMYSTGGTTGVAASDILRRTPSILGLTPSSPKPKAARTVVAKVQAAVNALDEMAARFIEIGMKTTKIDILIDTKPPSSTDFSLAMFCGLAGGHYECIEKYFTTLVETSRNLK